VETKHFNITVSGKVQGVYFRVSAKEKADELNVKGYVCNRPDGHVYIEAEADEVVLNKFVTWCSQGPAHAIVEHVDLVVQPCVGYTNFEIKR
jgi:acylphosphatase